jgi:uncharacterized RDD family membrane protein YckC
MNDGGAGAPSPRPDRRYDVAVGVAAAGARLAVSAGRLALLPVRLAARTPVVGAGLNRATAGLAKQGREARARASAGIEAVTGEVADSAEIQRAVDRALAGPLTEAVARSIAERRIVERVTNEMLATGELEEAVAAALEDQRTQRLLDRSLAAPGLERLVVSAVESRLTAEVMTHVMQSPEVRGALTRQTASFADELVTRVRGRLERLDDRISREARRLLRRPAVAPAGYGGVTTRALALAGDVALAQLFFLVVVAVLALVASLVGELRPAWLVGTLIGIGWLLIVGGYLVLFWTLSGQTPGMRLMRLRVVAGGGQPPGLSRSIVRLVGLALAIVPLFAGFLPVLFDSRRRGLQDFLAGTTVQDEPKALEPPRG